MRTAQERRPAVKTDKQQIEMKVKRLLDQGAVLAAFQLIVGLWNVYPDLFKTEFDVHIIEMPWTDFWINWVSVRKNLAAGNRTGTRIGQAWPNKIGQG